jgi:hypothetical protein
MRSASPLESVSPLTGETGVSASTVTRTMIVFLPDWFQSALDTAALPLIQFQP